MGSRNGTNVILSVARRAERSAEAQQGDPPAPAASTRRARPLRLKRYHDIQVSTCGVWRILRRLGLNRLPSWQRYKRHKERLQRYEKPQPGHSVQVDVKFIAPIAGTRKRHYQYTATDDCTRLRILKIYNRLNQKTAIQFIDHALERLPFRVELIQTQRCRVPIRLSLACTRPPDSTCLHKAGHASSSSTLSAPSITNSDRIVPSMGAHLGRPSTLDSRHPLRWPSRRSITAFGATGSTPAVASPSATSAVSFHVSPPKGFEPLTYWSR